MKSYDEGFDRMGGIATQNTADMVAKISHEATNSCSTENSVKTDDTCFVAQLQVDPEVAKHYKLDELDKLCSLDFHAKEVNNWF